MGYDMRASWWDYSQIGCYFLTVCTFGRQHYFGDVVNGSMQLSPIGVLADEAWYWIPLHQQNVTLHVHIVMPDHVHMLFSLHAPGSYGPVGPRACLGPTESAGRESAGRESAGEGLIVEAKNVEAKACPWPLRAHNHRAIRYRNPGKHTVSSIVGGYKSIITTKARQRGYDFRWQPSFYDRIVRSDDEFFNVIRYIQQNPQRWQR